MKGFFKNFVFFKLVFFLKNIFSFYFFFSSISQKKSFYLDNFICGGIHQEIRKIIKRIY